MTDLRLAWRTLRRAPAFSATVVLTLAVGIGAAGAAYSTLAAVILRPLPYAPASRVMMVAERDSANDVRATSYLTFQDWQRGTEAFDAMAFARGLGTVLKTDQRAEKLVAAFVSADFFRVLPERAAVGRLLLPTDFQPGVPPVAVMSWRLWRQRFGGDRGAVGRTVTLNEVSTTIVGVMPARFLYPTWADLYAPITTILTTDAALAQRGVHVDSRVVARLRPGVDSAAGVRALSAAAAHLAEQYPAELRGWTSVAFLPVTAEILGDTGAQLRFLTGAAVFVLLIAGVNVAGLTMARAGGRSKELAIRTALGGGRGALVRLLAAESAVLSALGGLAGGALASVLVGWIRSRGSDFVPRTDEIAVEPVAVLVTAAVAALIVTVLGLLPAIRADGPLTVELREGGGSGLAPARGRLRRALVAGEVALALVLLTGAGLLLKSLDRLLQVPTGLDDSRLLTVPIDPPSPGYDDPDRALQLYRDVATAVGALPGVRSVALTNHAPLSGGSTDTDVEINGRAADGRAPNQALFREVDSRYFRTAGIPILHGRDLSADEMVHPGDAVLVNQAFASRYFPGEDPIGRRVTVRKVAQGRPDFGQPIRATIVGVAGNVRHYSLDTDFVPEVYLPYTVTAWPRMALLVRTAGDPARLVPTVTRAVRAVSPDLPLEGPSGVRVNTLSESLAESLAYRRLITSLLGGFAAIAVLLAALGIYGVVAYVVTARTREMGIRMALGARRRHVLGLVLKEGAALAVAGSLLGVLGAAVTTRWLQTELYDTGALDPVTFGVAIVVLLAVVAAATLVPAHRATTIDPARTLQAE